MIYRSGVVIRGHSYEDIYTSAEYDYSRRAASAYVGGGYIYDARCFTDKSIARSYGITALFFGVLNVLGWILIVLVNMAYVQWRRLNISWLVPVFAMTTLVAAAVAALGRLFYISSYCHVSFDQAVLVAAVGLTLLYLLYDRIFALPRLRLAYAVAAFIVVTIGAYWASGALLDVCYVGP